VKKIIKNTLALVVGIFIGGLTNMLIISNSNVFIALPKGVVSEDLESLSSNIHLFEPIHFLMPFLAHSMGTFCGAFLASKIAVNHKFKFALTIGVFFLIGGVQMSNVLDSPFWFDLVDVCVAYIPMSLLGYKLAVK
jgi:hypothetical protein